MLLLLDSIARTIYTSLHDGQLSLFLVSGYMSIIEASLVAWLVKNLPAMQETPVQFLGWKDPLEK